MVIASLPPQSEFVTTTQAGGQGNGALRPTQYTYDFTVTTATTEWAQPTFEAVATVPNCTEQLCPAFDHQTCQDPTMGHKYAILCDTRFVGTIITTSGKHKRVEDEERDMEEAALAASSLGEREAAPAADAEASLEDRDISARVYTGSFVGCADACGMLQGCLGMIFNAGNRGNCQTMAVITGTFDAPGEIAALKL